MRTRAEIEAEVNDLSQQASLWKWLGVANLVGGIWLSVQEHSMMIFIASLLGVLLVFGIWGSNAARIQALREELQRHF